MNFFPGLSAVNKSIALGDHFLVKSQLKIEQRIAAETHRRLIADVRVERLNSSLDSPQFQEKSNRELAQSAYVNFLNFLIVKLSVKDSVSALDLSLEFCLTDDSSDLIYFENIPRIFAKILELNPEGAIDFYQTHQSELDKIDGIKLILKKATVKLALAKFSDTMALQSNPLGVLPLIRFSIDSPDEFAVVLLWLLQRDVTEKAIFETHLLHDFLSYYLFTIGQSDSPVLQLYTILAQFPKGRQFIEQAQKIRCEERGIQSYSLTGEVVVVREGEGLDESPKVELQSVKKREIPLDISPTKANFTSLYGLYGLAFLQVALVWYQAVEEDDDIEAVFVQVINDKLTIEQLSALINQIASGNTPKTLELLASFISEIAVDRLIKNNQGSVLHLLPHKDIFYRKISDLNVAEFLRQYAEENVPDLDAIPQLMAMFNVFRLVNDDIAGLVYEAILERMLQNPMLFDDETLVKRLKKFGERDALLKKKLAQFESQLDRCISRQSQSIEFTVEGYHTINETSLRTQ